MSHLCNLTECIGVADRGPNVGYIISSSACSLTVPHPTLAWELSILIDESISINLRELAENLRSPVKIKNVYYQLL